MDVPSFLDALAKADYRYILLATGAFLLSLIARGLAWQTLLQGKASFNQTFFTINEGYLLNNVLPFRLGEIGRAFLLSRKAPIGFWQVFPTILLERAFDVALAVGLVLISLPFVLGADWAGQAAFAVGILVVLGFIGLYVLARYRSRAMSLFEKLADRWPIFRKLGRERLQAFFTGLAVLTDLRRFAVALALMIIVWVLTLIEYYLVLAAFVASARLVWASFSLGVAALGVAVPSSPGYIGVVEASIVGALSLFSVDPSAAFAYAVTVHLLYVLITAVFGLYGLVRDGESIGQIYRSVRGRAGMT